MHDTPPSQSEENAQQLPELFQLLQPHLAVLDRYLEAQVSEFEPEIRQHVAYSIDAGGKRIRPSLIFFSGWSTDSHVDERLVQLAAIIEIVHLATLVHDDIMDEADIRRNRPTVAKKYNNATAVLLGDALFSHAVYLATQFPTTEVCRNIALSMRQVCTGEILQTMQRGNPDIDLQTYFRVIDLKTAELFRVSCHLGAHLAGFEEPYVQAAGTFGRHLGIAYQIYDDMTDLFGSQEKIGKTLGTDLATGKPTLPLILMRDRLPEDQSRALRQTLSGQIEADLPRWMEQLRQTGIFEEVRSAINQEIEKARAAIAPFPQNPSASHLQTISQLLQNQVNAL